MLLGMVMFMLLLAEAGKDTELLLVQWRAWGGGGTLSMSTPFIFISFLYFILRFWNQILIWRSVRLSMAAISIRLANALSVLQFTILFTVYIAMIVFLTKD